MQVAFGAHADLTLATTGLSSIDPQVVGLTRAPSPIAPTSPAAPSDRRSSTVDERRTNRFQLAPERVSALLTAQHDTRARSSSPGLVRRHGSRRSLHALIDEHDEHDDYEFGEEITNADGIRRVLRNDAAFVMRRRAEEGYGLDSVSPRTWIVVLTWQLEFNAAVATRFPGAERVAGIWEFVDRK